MRRVAPRGQHSRHCERIALARANGYGKGGVGTGTVDNLALRPLIDEACTRQPFYGTRCVGLVEVRATEPPPRRADEEPRHRSKV
jgi:hypothetical protein